MSGKEQVVVNDTQTSLIEQLGKAFMELEACKNASGDKVQWVEIEEHFRNLEAMLKKKSDELDTMEKEYKEKEAETSALISEREAAVVAKEQDLQDRVQELKDAAVAVIAEARATHMPASSELVDGDNKESKLTESYPPVPLLKTYLKELRRNSQGKSWNSDDASAVRNDVNAQELAALKAVIRCVEEYKLESDYPLEPLQKRMTQLERSKADKKRNGGDFVKRPQPKKPRASGGYHGYRSPGASVVPARQAPPVYGERAAAPVYMGMSERYPAHASTYNYQVAGQSTYAPPQAMDQRLYYYPQDERVPAAQYNPDQSSYGSYIGSVLQSPQQPYM